ncbi:hypothetical protein [Moraxella canis]|uniref:Uncharacterized protein n=1 Tax=Moraxella canis TaxID=90239 RepID=A0A1S9ZPP3_9GAMM|nr:hypothetical protein [Moraxella canis]OOR85320.1 hypothetical protein B0180_00540 [Moraxella canis]
MSALSWLIGLCLLLGVLFLLALIKPALKRPSKRSLGNTLALSNTDPLKSQRQKLYHMLSASLPGFDIVPKSNRLLISRQGNQVAIITLDDQAVMAERQLGDVLILNLNTRFTAQMVSDLMIKIRAHADQVMD